MYQFRKSGGNKCNASGLNIGSEPLAPRNCEEDKEKENRFFMEFCREFYPDELFSVAVIRVYDESGAVMETHEHAGDFKEW